MAAATYHVNVSDAASAINQQQLLMQQQQQQLLQHHHRTDDGDDDPGPSSTCSKTIPLDGLHCYGNERQMLQDQAKFFNNPLLSDVVLKVGDRVFYAHKFILIRSSDVFERMFSSDWQDHSKKELELTEESICNDVFSSFLRFLYSCHVVLTLDNTLPLLILADKYDIRELQNVSVAFACNYIIPKLQLKDVFHVWFQYASKCMHQGLLSVCVSALSQNMDDITQSDEWSTEWLSLDRSQLVEFLKSSQLCVKDEFELWTGIEKWLNSAQHRERLHETESYLKILLPLIRFPMMTAEQVSKVQESKLAEKHADLFEAPILRAYKYLSLPLKTRAVSKEFTSSDFLLRNYLDLRWDKRLALKNFSCFQKKGVETSLRFTTRSSSYPVQNWEWELKINPKANSTDDFRCVLHSNLILDQPRPVEYMLSVVSDESILTSVTGCKNFSKNRYSTDTEIDKKIAADLTVDSPYLVNDTMTMQISIRPVQ